ncbi:DNA-binding protein SMUBP-2-like [Brevipalpus obovatus]|uniref:DNA-binding protein SMUBP-2-like n=1 Tax=Brevipalpus obovatus TaxID=246614 RepID=UPI003D9E49EC
MMSDQAGSSTETRDAFVETQLELLELEYQSELEKTKLYQSVLSPLELVREGVCIHKLRINSVRNGLFLRNLITFGSNQLGQNLPAHRITTGDIVSVQSGNNRETLATGVVYSLSSLSICIAIEKESKFEPDTDCYNYMVVKISNDVTHRRLKKAMENLRVYPVGGRSHHLIEVIFANQPPSDPFPEESIKFINQNLNPSQQEAVSFALSRRELAIIHGPPGTGKTTTLVEIILQLRAKGLKVLVCAPSNIAVDNLVEKLATCKVHNMVRLGHPARASPALQKFTLDAVISRSEEREIIDDIRKEIEDVRRGRSWNKRAEVRELTTNLKSREKEVLRNSLRSASIILSTLISASPEGPLKHIIHSPEYQPDVLVIDECSQALEAACWITIPMVKKCILGGDHFQLPPTIVSEEAAEKGLQVTLMEKCLSHFDHDKVVRILTVQYRMHQSIMEWSSKSFYSNHLQADDSVRTHLLGDIVPSISTCPALSMIDTAGCDMMELDLEDEESKGNENEADIVAVYTKSLIEKGVDPAIIGIITPYNLQVELIRLRLSAEYPSLEIKSVDGFQGREKEVIILSLVRSNEERRAGFLADYRRINVAVTRARRHLAVICDSETVSSEPHLESLMKYLHDRGEVRSAHEFEPQMSVYKDIERPQHLRFKVHKNISKSTSSPQKHHQVTHQPNTVEKKERKLIKPAPQEMKVESERDRIFIQMIKDKIRSFSESDKPELILPAAMTSFERRLVHEVADKFGLLHISKGEGDGRHLVIWKKGASKDVEVPKEETENGIDIIDEELSNNESESSIKSGSEPEKEEKPKSEVKKAKKKKPKSKKKKKGQEDVKLSGDKQDAQASRKSFPVGETSKKKPLTKKQDLDKKLQELEEFDDIVEMVQKLDAVCFYINCSTKTKTLGQNCMFCMKRFCLTHSMPEIHGCGTAVRNYARSQVRKEGKIYPGTGQPNHLPDPFTRAGLERKLNKKLEAIVSKRKPKKKNKEDD